MAGESGKADAFHQKLDLIYDAAFDAAAFKNLSAVIADVTQSANGALVVMQDGIPVDLSATTSHEAQQDYLAYYGRIDIWERTMAGLPLFTFTRSQERISDDDVLNSEFYNDYARHLGMWHPMGLFCRLGPGLLLKVGVNRTRTARQFSKEEETQFLDLMRHVQRALVMRRQFQNAETRAQAGFAALDKLAFAAIVADATGRVLYANAKAEDLNRQSAGLTVKGGRVGCAVPSQAAEFSRLVRDAATGGAGGATRLTDAAGLIALLTLVTPLPSRLSETQNGAGRALIAIRKETGDPVVAEMIVSRLFGLTRSEAQVVCAVAAGGTLDEIAVQRGVKITTIKTQIEAAFRKTGTENQRDLMRLIGKLPQLL